MRSFGGSGSGGMPGPRHPMAACIALALALPAAAIAQPGPDSYELGIAQREAGRLRGLAERLNKQNLLYQLHLAGTSKVDMAETSSEIDRLIDVLERGSSAYAVAKPPNEEVRRQLEVVNEAWSPLRRLALASPYDYLRHRSELIPAQSRLGDPLMIRGFDRLNRRMIGEAESLMRLYQDACSEAGGELCDLAANAGFFAMLAERVARQLVLVYAGFDVEESIEGLKESRSTFDEGLARLGRSPVLAAAADPARGASGRTVATLWKGMQEDWGRLRFEVDLAIESDAEALDIPRMLELQTRLVEEMERLRGALSRYAAALQESG